MIVRRDYRGLPTVGKGLGAISPETEAAVAALLPGARIVQTIAPGTTSYGGVVVTTGGENAIVLPDGTRISAEGFEQMLERSDREAVTGSLFSMILSAKSEQQGLNLPEAVMASRAAIPAGSLPPLEQLATTPGYAWPASTAAASGAKTATKSGSSPGVTVYYPRVSLSNLTRPGQPFQVDDELLLQIGGGQPNAPVNATATHNGSSSTTDFGRTDAGGFFQVRVQMSEAEIGQWQETWRIGPEEASPRLSFSVAAKPSAAATGAGAGQTPAQPPAQQQAASAPPAILEQLKALPWWVWAALGGGIFLLRKA